MIKTGYKNDYLLNQSKSSPRVLNNLINTNTG